MILKRRLKPVIVRAVGRLHRPMDFILWALIMMALITLFDMRPVAP